MKVGDYVRLDRCQGIARIDEYDEEYNYFLLDRDYYDEWGDPICRLDENDVIKSSPNIIDLIEVGDYVNGVIVTQSYIDNIKHIAPEIKENNYGIKSIVTKEQFESMEYKVGE